MWPYPQKRQQRAKFLFFLKIALLTFIAHIIFLFFIFFVYRGDTFKAVLSVNIPINIHRAKIVYMPFYKNVNQLRGAGLGKRAQSTKIQTKEAPKKATVQKRKMVVAKKTVLSKPKPPAKKIVKQPLPKKQEQRKAEEKKIAQEKETLKQKQKELEQKKKEAEIKKQEQKRAEEKKIAQEKETLKQEQQELEQKKKEVEKKIETKYEQETEISENIDAKESQRDIEPIDEDEHVIYMGRYDLEAMRSHQLLQEEVQKVWHCPVGVSADISCQLKVELDWNGKVDQLLIDRPSGMPIFDLSAKSAAHKTQYPKMFWGKTIIITF